MTDNIFQSISTEESHEDSEFRFSATERFVLLFYLKFIAAILIIAGWSGILLLTGNTEGGGPLGTLAELLHIECLRSFAELLAST